jgi:hypothetical protein
VFLLLFQQLRRFLQQLHGPKAIANLLRRLHGGDFRFDVGFRQRSEAKDAFGGRAVLPASLPLPGHLSQELLGVDEFPLTLANLRQLHQDVLVFRFELQRLFVQCGGFREESFCKLVIRHADVLLDRLLVIARPQVQIAERVDRRPVLRLIVDQAHVLGDRRVELSLLEQLVGLL